MPSSLRLREGRLVLGANKKIRIYSAEGSVTVGVIRHVFNPNVSSRPLKASKGAERSLPRRARGSRGLRRGKGRARGRHPRSLPIRQPLPNNFVSAPNRVLRSHLRMCDWQRRLRLDFIKQVKTLDEQGRFSQPVFRHGSLVPGVGWKKTKAKWERLHSHLVRTSTKLLADTALSHRFNPFIEGSCGIVLKSGPQVGSVMSDTLGSLLVDLGKNLPKMTSETKQASAALGASGSTCTGQFCRTCGRRSFRGAPCPGKPSTEGVSTALRRERRYQRPQR
jgi:hypothetical protein